MDDDPVEKYKPGLLRVLYVVGLSGLADAISVKGRDKDIPDYVKKSVEYFDAVVRRAISEGQLQDAQAAEAALGDVLGWVPKFELAGTAARGREALRARVMTEQAVRRRRELGSDSGIAYFDDLLGHTIALLVAAAERGAWPELVAVATSRVLQDDVEAVRRDVTWLADSAGRPQPLDEVAVHSAVAQAGAKARDELRPEILPALDRIQGMDGGEFPRVVLGEGGLGKSVLAGQLYDRYVAVRPTLLILCSHLPASVDVGSADRIGVALGSLASGLEVGLRELLLTYDERPLLIIDTIDLLLRDQTVDDIVAVLKATADLADLVITCREREWRDLVESSWRPQAWSLPALTKPEVLSLAERFAADTRITTSTTTAFLSSLDAVLDRRRALDVLGVPLRLAMTCALYAADGRMPDDLTVTQLYKQYWQRRVRSDRKGRVTATSRQKEGAALDIAANVWRASQTRFVEDVPLPAATHAEQLLELLSEGVVKEAGLRVSFFHQTFAEFAVAKHLAGYGAEPDWTRLGDGLSVGRSGYWGLASHLITEEMSPERLAAVAAGVPRTSVEGARLLVRLAFVVGSGEILTELLELHPAMLAAAADVLGEAPNAQARVTAAILLRLLSGTSTNLTQIRGSLAKLIRSHPGDEAAELLVNALDTLTASKAELSILANEVVKLLTEVFAPGLGADLLPAVIGRYETLPLAGQAYVIRMVSTADRLELDTALLDAALQRPRPDDVLDECVRIMIRQWTDPTVREARGWSSWREILTTTYSTGWGGYQVHIVRALAANEAVAAEIIDEALRPMVPALPHRRRVVGAARLVAEDHPGISVTELLRGFAATREAVGIACQLVRTVEAVAIEAQRLQLADQFFAVAHLEPRLTWPAVLKLSLVDSEVLASRLDALADTVRRTPDGVRWPQVVAGAVDALLYAATAAELAPHLARINAVVKSCDGVPAACEARLRAAFAAVSQEARDAIDRMVDVANVEARGYAVAAVIDRIDDWSSADWAAVGLDWFVGFLRVRREGAVPKLARRLKIDADCPDWRQHHTTAVHTRLLLAIDRDEDPQTASSLLAVLAEAAHRPSDVPPAAPTVAEVEELLAAYQRGTERAMAPGSELAVSHLPAVYAHACSALTDVAKAVLPISAVVQRTLALLTGVDTGAIAATASRNLKDLLNSVVQTSPEAWSSFEAAWPDASESNKRALAECALYSPAVPNGHEVALRLARRADCPKSVSAYVHRIVQ